MKVLVSNNCGFCFGVEHAIELAQQMLDQGKKVYCLGQLIHNKQVVERLVQAGMVVVDDLDQIPTTAEAPDAEPPTVLIRSHGCRPELIEKVKARGLQLADATCVLVKKAQKLVSQLHEDGYKIVVVGDPDHPEVQSAVGYAPEVTVVASPEDLDKLPKASRIAVISQTTRSAEQFGNIVGLIATRGYHEIKAINTICHETSRRQAAAVELCSQVDVMFVLGSHTSANTGKLADLCRRNGVKTHHLQSWQDFRPEFVTDVKVAGITAGASTPEWIIKTFVENLRRL